MESRSLLRLPLSGARDWSESTIAQDYGEVRWIALGRTETEVYRVVYTWTSENRIRIISAQKANHEERETYYRQKFP